MVFRALFLLSAGLIVTVAAQACTSISYTSAFQTTCTPLDACNGLLCFNSLRKRNVSFTVQSCSDPVLVNYTILHSETGALISTNQLNGTFVLGNATHEMHWNISRNASHLFIQSYISVLGHFLWLVPEAILSLNASYCQCTSLQDVIETTEIGLPGDSVCVNNTNCTGMQCGLDAGSAGRYNIESEVEPCSHPPGFILIITNANTNTIIFDQYFNTSKDTTVSNFFPLRVTIVHREYSMLVSVTLTIFTTTYYIVPESQVILDKSNCPVSSSQSMSLMPSTMMTMTSTFINLQTTTTSVSPTPITSSETCSSLRSIADRSLLHQCSTNPQCDTIQCSVTGYNSNFQILPCNNPPGFHVTVYDPDNNKIYDEVVTNTTTIPLSDANGFYLLVLVDRDKVNDTITLEVKFKTYFTESDVIPKTVIPLNTCQQCSSASCISSATSMSKSASMSKSPSMSKSASMSKSTSMSKSASMSIIVQTPTARSESRAIVAVGISVPIILLMIIIAVSIVAVTVVIVLLRRKREGNTRLRFASMGDDEAIMAQPEDGDSVSVNSESAKL